MIKEKQILGSKENLIWEEDEKKFYFYLLFKIYANKNSKKRCKHIELFLY